MATRAAPFVLVAVLAGCGGTHQVARGPIVATKLTGELALYRIDPANGRAVRLSPGHDARDSQPACAPDGRTVVFVRETTHGVELRLLDLRARGSRLLRRLDDASVQPAWSPDGKRIAFVHDRTGNGDDSIWTMKADGTARRRITHGDGDHAPAWSPDGRRIAFERGYDVWLVDADGGNERVAVVDAQAPTWAPDGTLLVSEYRLGDGGLYALRDGHPLQRLVPGTWPEACWARS